MRKNYVLDTNVLIHDPDAIFKFDDNNIIIPATVVDELGKLKREPGQLGRDVREAIRNIENAIMSEMEGFRVLHKTPGVEMEAAGCQLNNDDKILAETYFFKTNGEFEGEVVIVSKDRDFRIKCLSAKSKTGIGVEDYRNSLVEEKAPEIKVTAEVPRGTIDEFYTRKELPAEAVLAPGVRLNNNGYVVMESGEGQGSALGRLKGDKVIPLNQKATETVFNIRGRNSGQRFLLDAMFAPDIDLVVCEGGAGTGKTLMTIVAGLRQVLDKKYSGVVIMKAIQSIGQKMGYLPGEEKDKLRPWLSSYYDNFDMLHRSGAIDPVDKLMAKGQVSIEALEYARGRSFMGKLVIVDEVQNLFPGHVKTIVTRIGEGSKLVLLGDTSQIDTPTLSRRDNGLSYVISKMAGDEGTAIVNLEKSERSRLAQAGVALL